MIGIYNGLVVDALTIVRAPEVDVWVVEAGTQGPFAEASRIPGDTRDAVARLHGVAEAGSVTYQTVEVEFAGRTLRLYVVGFEPGRPGAPLASGRGPAIGRSHYEIVADRRGRARARRSHPPRARHLRGRRPRREPGRTRAATRRSTCRCATRRRCSSSSRRRPPASRSPAAPALAEREHGERRRGPAGPERRAGDGRRDDPALEAPRGPDPGRPGAIS